MPTSRSRSGSRSASMSIPKPKDASARMVSSADVTCSPSGADAAAASASSSVWRRPKTTSSAIVSSGIQSTRLEGSPPRPKPAAADSAASSIANGALPLRRIPSRSAMSAAPAVLKAVELLGRPGGLRQRPRDRRTRSPGDRPAALPSSRGSRRDRQAPRRRPARRRRPRCPRSISPNTSISPTNA